MLYNIILLFIIKRKKNPSTLLHIHAFVSYSFNIHACKSLQVTLTQTWPLLRPDPANKTLMIVDWEYICRERLRGSVWEFSLLQQKKNAWINEEKWFYLLSFHTRCFYFPLLFSCFKNITYISPTSNIELKKNIFSLVLSWIPTRAVNLRHVNKV